MLIDVLRQLLERQAAIGVPKQKAQADMWIGIVVPDEKPFLHDPCFFDVGDQSWYLITEQPLTFHDTTIDFDICPFAPRLKSPFYIAIGICFCLGLI